MRRIVQISATTLSADDYRPGDTLYALCDDGSTWMLFHPFAPRSIWERLPDIPQDEKTGFNGHGYEAENP